MLIESKRVWHHGAKPPGPPPMDITELKAKTVSIWRELHLLNECIIPDDQAFQSEVQQYGDLDNQTTWENAYAALKAKFLAEGCLDEPQYLIEFYLLYDSQKWGWRELLPAVVNELAMIPEGLEALNDGLSTIQKRGCEYGADRAEVNQLRGVVHGFAETAARGGLESERIPISSGNSD